jgi:hypothetical protein
LLKHLKELKVEQTVNGKAFYKTYVKGEEFNHVQRDKSMSLWVSMIQNIIYNNVEQASRVAENATIEDDVINVLDKQKEQAEARKGQREQGA